METKKLFIFLSRALSVSVFLLIGCILLDDISWKQLHSSSVSLFASEALFGGGLPLDKSSVVGNQPRGLLQNLAGSEIGDVSDDGTFEVHVHPQPYTPRSRISPDQEGNWKVRWSREDDPETAGRMDDARWNVLSNLGTTEHSPRHDDFPAVPYYERMLAAEAREYAEARAPPPPPPVRSPPTPQATLPVPHDDDNPSAPEPPPAPPAPPAPHPPLRKTAARAPHTINDDATQSMGRAAPPCGGAL